MKLRTKITILTTVIAVSVVFFTLLPIRALVINAFRGELRSSLKQSRSGSEKSPFMCERYT